MVPGVAVLHLELSAASPKARFIRVDFPAVVVVKIIPHPRLADVALSQDTIFLVEESTPVPHQGVVSVPIINSMVLALSGAYTCCMMLARAV